MKISVITSRIFPQRLYNHRSGQSISRQGSNIITLKECNIGAMQDGIIGKIRVKDIKKNEDVFLDVQKWVEDSGLEHYMIRDGKNNALGGIEFIQMTENERKHIWIEHLVNYTSRHRKYREERWGDYTGIGTRLMQIAQKRSEEMGCDGNIELFSTTSAIDFYKKIGFQDFLPKLSRFEQHRMYLTQGGKQYLSKKYGGL